MWEVNCESMMMMTVTIQHSLGCLLAKPFSAAAAFDMFKSCTAAYLLPLPPPRMPMNCP
jgi:hypothetical protein